MTKRPMLFLWISCLAAWIITRVFDSCVSLEKNFTNFTILGISVTLLAFALLYRTGVRRLYYLAPVLFFVYLFNFGFFYKNLEIIENNSQQIIEIIAAEGAEGRIGQVEYKNDKTYLYIESAYSQSGEEIGGVLVIFSGEQDFEPGMKITFRGEAELISKATNPGQFDSKAYYQSKGISFRIMDPENNILSDNTFFEHGLYKIKRLLKQAIEFAAGEDSGVCVAMLLGEKGDLSDDTKNLYQAGGISHILAISGLHVSFIGLIVFKLLTVLRLGKITSTIGTSLFVFLYSIMTGSPVSAIRAATMLCISLIAKIIGRTYDIISAMGFSWCVVCFIYPGQLCQAGFQLSFGAIIAFGFLLPKISGLFGFLRRSAIRRKKRMTEMLWNRLEDGFLGSLAVSMVTWPIIAWHMYVISPLSLVVNLIVIPFMTILMVDIIGASLVGLLSLGGIIPKGIATYAWMPAHYLLKLYSYICRQTSDLNIGQVVTGRPEVYQIIIYFICIILVIMILSFVNNYLEKKKDIFEFGGGEWDKYKVVKKTVIRLILIPLFVMVLLSGLLLLKRPKQKSTFIALDVGQGDGMLYLDGDYCLAIDGGNSFATGIGSYRIEPALEFYGYKTVNIWFVTHPDTDHISGLLEILNDASTPLIIEKLVIPKTSDTSAWGKLYESAADKSLIYSVLAGDTIAWGKNSITILHPENLEYAASNENSLVMRLDTEDKSFLLCGDIDTEAEELLLNKYKGTDLLLADVLKVAHHGSKYSSSTAFLEAVSPSIALISVGKNNYGHPAPETLERLEEICHVYTTKSEGAIIIK